MRVSAMDIVTEGAFCQVQAWVEGDAGPGNAPGFEPYLLWHRYPDWCLPYLSTERADAFLAALLLPAMKVSERLTLPAPVSPQLLSRVWDIQSIFLSFDRRLHRVEIVAPEPMASPLASPSATGLFFSLGVDSFFSLLRERRRDPRDAPPDHLLAVHGIDVLPAAQSSEFPLALLENSARVARETGTRLVPIVTNIRQFTEPIVRWNLSHGSALASIALALSGLLGRALIAATTTYDQLYPWGSHPLLDPLWSTENLAFLHDGCETGRIDKVQHIATNQLVLDTLRVCPGYTSAYNCGLCVKCLPTMIDLLQLGALQRSPVFPHEIDIAALRGMLRAQRGSLNVENYQRRLEALGPTGGPHGLREALSDYLATESDTSAPVPPAKLDALTQLLQRMRE